jgi:hypothetical protein
MTVKKHIRAQQVALDNHLPCVYLVDSGGAFLPLQAEVFPDKGPFRTNLLQPGAMSAESIAQSCRRHGLVHRGWRVRARHVLTKPSSSKVLGRFFSAGPPLVKAGHG